MKITNLDNLEQMDVSHNPKVKKQMMIGFDELSPLVQFSRALFPPGEMAPSHSHADMAEVFFIESGEGSITVDGNVYPLRAGDCITVEPGERHELNNAGQETLTVIYFGIKTKV